MPIPTLFYKYVAGQFLIWFLGTFGLLLALNYFGDIVELIRRANGIMDVRISTLIEMAAMKIPYNAQEMTPFAVLMGSILATWRMTRAHELVVARAAGISAWQFLSPALVMAFGIGIVGTTIFNPVASSLQRSYVHIDNRILRKQPDLTLLTHNGLWLRQRGADGTQVVIHGTRLPSTTIVLDTPTLLFLDDHEQVIRRVDGNKASLGDGNWTISDAWEWHPGANDAHFAGSIQIPTGLTTRKIEESFAAPETISFWSLPGFISLLEKSGFSAQRQRLYFDSLLARPFLLAAMVLIGAIFSLRIQRQGGTTAMMIGGVASGFLLYFLSDVAFALGSSAAIPVVLAAWTPAGVSMLIGATVLLYLEDG